MKHSGYVCMDSRLIETGVMPVNIMFCAATCQENYICVSESPRLQSLLGPGDKEIIYVWLKTSLMKKAKNPVKFNIL